LWHQGDSVRTRDRFARVQGRVGGCTAFRTAEMEAVALCGLGQPDEAERRLLGSLPWRTPGDLAEPRGLYKLLSDPPLPGIDRLRNRGQRYLIAEVSSLSMRGSITHPAKPKWRARRWLTP
jgi:hypothetical protein